MKINICYNLIITFLVLIGCNGDAVAQKQVIVGAEQPDRYIDQLLGKRVGVIVNQTSMVKNKHLVDYLLENNITIEAIFAPEHGFRGDADAGEVIKDGIDQKSGCPVTSLYGKNKKPTEAMLQSIDVLVFDIQDVGCRFYTYLSTLHYCMEACAEQEKRLILLDRPNPNGDYVAGPMLKPGFESFVGMHPIPVVHGCTLGEMASMINGEQWLNNGVQCNIEIIKVDNYTHSTTYELPIAPSPNLPNRQSIRLYPSLCFFEATTVSIGRGTDFPFQVIGYPDETFGRFHFTPRSIIGKAKTPRHENLKCFGADLRKIDAPKMTIEYFKNFNLKFENQEKFIDRKRFLGLLSGSDELFDMLSKNMSTSSIELEWEKGLRKYKELRKKYLLYPDFE